jgi:Protein of unknown function (DUF3800)
MADTFDEAGQETAESRVKKHPLSKQERLQKEANALAKAVSSGDISALKNRVAGVLNLFPHTRNSDVSLALKYWETFQADVYSRFGIKPNDLFKLERVTNIVRVRQKIQNEYRLFVADGEVKKRRRGREDEIKQSVISDGPSRNLVFVFADETGKTDRYAMVAAVWVLNGEAVYRLGRAIDAWQDKSSWANRELHFKKLRGLDIPAIREYLEIIKANRQYLSFKIISADQHRTHRSIAEIIRRLHEYMLVRGAEHELETGRIALPYELEVSIDNEQSLDEIAIADMRSAVRMHFKTAHEDRLSLHDIKTVESRHSQMIQLADLIAGAANRKRNGKGDLGDKDEIADLIIDALDLVIEAPEELLLGDASAFLQI